VGSGGGSEGAKGSEYFTVTRRVLPANQKVKAHGDLNFLIQIKIELRCLKCFYRGSLFEMLTGNWFCSTNNRVVLPRNSLSDVNWDMRASLYSNFSTYECTSLSEFLGRTTLLLEEGSPQVVKEAEACFKLIGARSTSNIIISKVWIMPFLYLFVLVWIYRKKAYSAIFSHFHNLRNIVYFHYCLVISIELYIEDIIFGGSNKYYKFCNLLVYLSN